MPCSRGEFDGFGVAGVGVADDAHAGVGGQRPLQPAGGCFRAVGDDDLAGVQAVADADAAAVVDADPGRPLTAP